MDEAVVWIQAKLSDTVYRGMLDVGNYLFEKFFDGDLEKVKSQNPHKNASFRRLVKQCDTVEFPVSPTWLCNAVNLAVWDRLIPARAREYRSLPQSYQLLLLPMGDPKQVVRLAKVAVSEGHNVRSLRALVREERAKRGKDPRGRKPKPVELKALDRCIKALSDEQIASKLKNGEPFELSNKDSDAANQKIDEVFSTLEKWKVNLENQ